ncbi:MAG: glycosyltransferase [Lachnospiraceae bacterium]
MNPKVSLIVPVYNAEKYLNRCIDSVLKQDFTDYELILIDDGSSDASGAICDEYASKDGRIQVVHKENSGVSDSRNLAISLAKGEYLQFLDSDDWIIPEAVGLLVRAMEEHDCDMVIADFYRVVGERLARKGDIQENILLSREEFAIQMMEKPADFYYGVLWNKLYRREMIEAHGLRMDKDISWCEDFIFNMEYIRHVRSVYALQVPIYYYVKTKGSLVSQGTSIANTARMKRTVFKCYNEFYKDIFEEEDYEKSRFQVYRFLIDAAGDGMVPPAILPSSMKLGEERISISLNINENSGILLDAYREKKLLERYLEVVAIKHDLILEDVKLLFFLSQADENCTLQEIASVTGLKKTRVMFSVQKLINKEYLKLQNQKDLDDKKSGKKLELEFLPAAEAIISDLLSVRTSYDQVRYAGLTEEEIEQYVIFRERINSNVRNALK